jgi:hypothetical protein
MKKNTIYLFVFAGMFSIIIPGVCNKAFSQLKTLPDTSKMAYNTISKGLGLYAFPSKGQSQQKQKEDEFECYKWASEQSGIDPANPPKVEAAPVESGPNGSMVKGAAGGAAAGAAIGAIAGDAGEGAAIGAVAGGLRGVKKGRQQKAQANEKASQDVQKKQNEITASYTKAFQVCLEGKGYSIK